MIHILKDNLDGPEPNDVDALALAVLTQYPGSKILRENWGEELIEEVKRNQALHPPQSTRDEKAQKIVLQSYTRKWSGAQMKSLRVAFPGGALIDGVIGTGSISFSDVSSLTSSETNQLLRFLDSLPSARGLPAEVWDDDPPNPRAFRWQPLERLRRWLFGP